MSIQTVTVGPGLLTIGAPTALTDFSSQATAVKLVPKVKQDDNLAVLSGEEVPGDRTESWTIEGTLLQDFGFTTSKTEWLFAHRGEQHPFVFIPNNSGKKRVTGQLVVEAVEIGGDVKTKALSDFEFTLVGAPVIDAIPAG